MGPNCRFLWGLYRRIGPYVKYKLGDDPNCILCVGCCGLDVVSGGCELYVGSGRLQVVCCGLSVGIENPKIRWLYQNVRPVFLPLRKPNSR